MRVLFWGTPSFALPSFRALVGEDHDVVAVVTQPDRPSGRGQEVRWSPVKRAADEEHIPVLQPEKARAPEFVEQLRGLQPDISVVAAYGQILSNELLELPRLGSINVHASLLPELRGAAPINWAIIRGYDVTGVTIMRMVEPLDAGPILLQAEEPIGQEERASDLWIRLSEIGAATLVEALALLEFGGIEETEQDESRATWAPRITREDARIEWGGTSHQVGNRIRGLDEVPGAWTTLDGAELKVYRPKPIAEQEHDARPGTILSVDADPALGMLVACGQGAVWLREVKAEGRRRMTTVEWLRGRSASPGDRLK